MSRKIISGEYHHDYCKKLIELGRAKFGSIRQLSFALGSAPSVTYRWYHNEQRMNKIWVENLERLLSQD